MPNQSHDYVFRYTSFVHPSNCRYPGTMKTQMPQTNLTEEAPPIVLRRLRHVKGPLAPLGDHLSEQRDELRRERELRKSAFMALRAKPDDAVWYIDLAGNVYVGLTEPAALMPSYYIADPHPLGHGFEILQDRPMLDLSDAWLAFRSRPLDAKPFAGVDGRETALDRLAHDKAEQRKLEKGGVPVPGVRIFMRNSPPPYVVANSGAEELARDAYLALCEKHRKIIPSGGISLKRLLAACVALFKKARHPELPSLRQLVRALFLRRKLADEVARASGFADRIEAKVCRSLAARAGRRVEVTNPMKRTTGPSV